MALLPEAQSDEAGRRHRRGWLRRLLDRIVRGRRRLFLDDDPLRAELFLKDYPGAVWVTNVPACLARLDECWDEIHLDHDLNGRMFVDSADAESGMEVIRWLCKEPRPHLKQTRFFVHTHNATAGLLMVLILQCGGHRAEYRPFGLDLKKLLAHNEATPAPGAEADCRSPARNSRLRSWISAVAAGLARAGRLRSAPREEGPVGPRRM
jgi:hypothetical protein